MAQFTNDTFTEAGSTPIELQNHTSDSGHSWTANTAVRIDATNDFVQGTSGGNARLFSYTSVTPPSADYSVSMDVNVLNADNFTIAGPMARMQGASTNSGYAFCVDPNEQTVALYRYDAGSETQIGTPYSVDLSTPPVLMNLKVEVNGSTIKGYLDGTERASTTDSTYTTAGSVGFIRRQNTDNSDFEIDNFSADTLAAPTITGSGSHQATTATHSASGSVGTLQVSLDLVDVANTTAPNDTGITAVIYDAVGGTEVHQTATASITSGTMVVTLPGGTTANNGDEVFVTLHKAGASFSDDFNGAGRATVELV